MSDTFQVFVDWLGARKSPKKRPAPGESVCIPIAMKRFAAPPHFLYFSLIFAQSTVNENVSVVPGVAGTTAPPTGELSLMSGEGGRSARAEPPRATTAASARSVGRKRVERFMGGRLSLFPFMAS
jgi:hypothetical protein